MTVIVIYTPKVTNRIKYTFEFVFHQYFGIDYELTENTDVSILPEHFYISYGKEINAAFFTIYQDNLLLEDTIQFQNISVSREADLPVFFQTTENFDIRFDIFSCIFYLLSRYEEYLPHEKDIHGRYKSSNSILARKEFNFSPIVELWLLFFKQKLVAIQPNLSFKKQEFTYIATFDIDNAFRYLGRNLLKHPPNIFKAEYWKVRLNIQADPYAILDKILNETQKYDFHTIFFFLLNDDGNENSKVSPESIELRKVIHYICTQAEIGLHPSYHSLEKNLVQAEYHKLYQLSNRKTYHSRQHFLRISFPELLKNFKETNFLKTDYSLMYPDIIGFRAGISKAFTVYDLSNEEMSSITMQPSCWMDASFEYYRTENEDEIFENFLTIFNQLKEINGTLVTIFHNDLLATQKYWGIFRRINKQVNFRG